MDLAVTDHVVLITGASSGIGLAAAQILAAEGAKIVLVARDHQRLELACETLKGSGHQIFTCDVTANNAAEQIVGFIADSFGRLDAIVHSAGTTDVTPMFDLNSEDWDAQWRLNVLAPQALMQAANPYLRAASQPARVVFVGSSSGKRPSLRNVAYSVTKSAQHALARAWADQLAAAGIRVNTVAPGPVDGPLWDGPGGLADQSATLTGVTAEVAKSATASAIPLKRFGQPSEIANVVAFLASPTSGYVTGATWSADGGTVQTVVLELVSE